MNGLQRERAGADRCPGVLKPWMAEDGAIVRLRVPGGEIGVGVLTELVALAERFGSGCVLLTSRGNLQIRALPTPLPQEFTDRLAALGLLPSPAHERARNILAAPTRSAVNLAREIDSALCACPELSSVPGRFLTLVTGAEGTYTEVPWDVCVIIGEANDFSSRTGTATHATPETPSASLAAPDAVIVTLRVTGDERETFLGRRVDHAHAAGEVIDVMRRFLQHRDGITQWNLRDLPHARAAFPEYEPCGHPVPAAPRARRDLVGWRRIDIPKGEVTSRELARIEEASTPGGTIMVTPWRAVLIST